jgi:hypothetical protein
VRRTPAERGGCHAGQTTRAAPLGCPSLYILPKPTHHKGAENAEVAQKTRHRQGFFLCTHVVSGLFYPPGHQARENRLHYPINAENTMKMANSYSINFDCGTGNVKDAHVTLQ